MLIGSAVCSSVFTSIPEGPMGGSSGLGKSSPLKGRAMPTCQSCGAILQSVVWTASSTFFHPRREAPPKKLG